MVLSARMKTIFLFLITMCIQPSLQQSYTFSQPIVADPSPVCVGGTVTISCRVNFTNSAGNTFLASADIFRNGEVIRTGVPPNHVLVIDGASVVGILVSNISLDDDNVEYNCTTRAAPTSFVSSLTLNVTGRPSPVGMITVKSEACSVNFNMSWGAVTSNPVCGLLLYDVTISPSDGVTMMRITDTSYSFAGLLNATIYTVTVAGRNAAGVGLSNMEMVTTPNLNSFLPDLSVLSSTNVTHNIIVIEWEVTNNLICGDTSINVVTSPSHQNIDVDVDENNDMVTISNLENGTMYTITVTATNRAGSVTRMITATTLGGSTTNDNDGGDGDDSSPVGIIVGVLVTVVIVVVIVIVIIGVLYWYKKKQGEKSSDTTALNMSPTGTSTGGRATVAPSSNLQSGPTEVYADIQKPAANVPHQTAVTGEEYAVSTKATKPGKGKPQGPTEEYAQIDKSKKSGQHGIQYADLAALPQSTNDPSAKGPTSMYAQVA